MAALSLDLTPVVEALIERPFDSTALARARSAVGGHPQAYATALRCAAKRAPTRIAASYWLVEAARVHESVDDVGGAIALLSRAFSADPTNGAIREMLAGYMSRLCVRCGLGFVVLSVPSEKGGDPSAGAVDSRQSGLRPPPLNVVEERHRDTLPDLFAQVSSTARPPATENDPGASPELEIPLTERPMAAESVILLKSNNGTHRNALIPPPCDPEMGVESSVSAYAEASEHETGVRARNALEAAVPLTTRLDANTRAKSQPPPTVRSSATFRLSSGTAPPTVRGGVPLVEDVYSDVKTPITERPAGDRLVGALFEALHALHFVDNVRQGADFVQRVLAEKFRPRAALVHFYEFARREFVVVSAYGSRSAALLDLATPEDDPLVSELLKSPEAIVYSAPAEDVRFSKGRWLLVEPERSAACAAATIDGRYLGLLELVDPLDGSEFTEDDRKALTYVAAAFSKFLSSRGIVLTEDDDLDELAV